MEGTGLLYHRQVERLAPFFEVQVMPYDVDGPQTFAQFVAQARQYLPASPTDTDNATQSTPFYLCGFSLGACTAIQIALNHPDVCTGLFLINSATAVARNPFFPHLASSVLPYVPSGLLGIGSDLTLPANAVTQNFDPEDLALMKEVSRSVPRELMSARLRSLSGFDVSATTLARLKLPTLILAGVRDMVLPSPQEARRLADVLPNAEIQLLPNSGHECLQERDLDLGNLFSDFLQRRELSMNGARKLTSQHAV